MQIKSRNFSFYRFLFFVKICWDSFWWNSFCCNSFFHFRGIDSCAQSWVSWVEPGLPRKPASQTQKTQLKIIVKKGGSSFLNIIKIACLILVENFFNSYLAAPKPTLSHSQGSSFTYLMLISEFSLFWSESHGEPHNEVG